MALFIKKLALVSDLFPEADDFISLINTTHIVGCFRGSVESNHFEINKMSYFFGPPLVMNSRATCLNNHSPRGNNYNFLVITKGCGG